MTTATNKVQVTKVNPVVRHLQGGRDTYSCKFMYEGEEYYFAVQGGNTYWKRLSNIVPGDAYDIKHGGTFYFPPFNHATPEGQEAIAALKEASGYKAPEPIIL